MSWCLTLFIQEEEASPDNKEISFMSNGFVETEITIGGRYVHCDSKLVQWFKNTALMME